MCPACKCPNAGNKLGRLGRRIHYRCRDCGWQYSCLAPAPDWSPTRKQK